MKFCENNYYHLYNRSNNKETLFKEARNYIYFLNKYRYYLEKYVDTISYCLMPTHFHFLIYIRNNDDQLNKNIGNLLSSYTKAINKRFGRNGSLFQNHTQAKHIDNELYLLTLVNYIHQNPVRRKLVDKLEDWPYSSYLDYIGLRQGTLPNKGQILARFSNSEEFVSFSNQLIKEMDEKYWV